MHISYVPQLCPKFLPSFHCHSPTAPIKTNLISVFLPTHQVPQTKNLNKTHFCRSKMSSNNGDNNGGEFHQNVLVMRHGDRMDNFVASWVTTAERPWDPPLYDAGKTRAFKVGNEIRNQLNFPIHRVFVSPFLRCVQTASEVVSALCSSDGGSQIEPSKVKYKPMRSLYQLGCFNGRQGDGYNAIRFAVMVSIEYGLCEMLNREAIRPGYAPKDGEFHFNISELEAMLPAGTVDHTAERIYQEMPRWEETVLGSRSRYEHVIQALADKYPRENLLLVTHGEGVGTSISSFKKHAVVYDVNYCAYSHARRSITIGEGGSVTTGNFELLTAPQVTGISYCITDTLFDGV